MIKMRKIVLVIASLLIASAMLCNNNNTKVKKSKEREINLNMRNNSVII